MLSCVAEQSIPANLWVLQLCSQEWKLGGKVRYRSRPDTKAPEQMSSKKPLCPPPLTEEQLDKFRWIRDRFRDETPLPSRFNPRIKNSAIWLRVVSQVVVIGGAAQAAKLQDPAIREKLDYELLCSVSSTRAVKLIGEALREIGTRRVSAKSPERSPKVVYLAKNLDKFKNHLGGPREFVRKLEALDSSVARRKYVEECLSYFGPKGSRDFLTTGLGLATDLIALDSRVMGVVRRIVPEWPETVKKDEYDALEDYLVHEVCTPLSIPPVLLDQLLFRHSKEINAKLDSMTLDPDLSHIPTEALKRQQRQIRAELQRRQSIAS
jgi:hypothetical protein